MQSVMRRIATILFGLLLLFVPAAHGSFPLVVKDALGRTVAVRRAPERIVSLAPSVTEILFALGLDARIVGVSTADDYPPEKVRSKPRVGGLQLDVERIVGLRPDLIVGVASLQRGQLDRLVAMGLLVLAVDARSLADIYAQIGTIGLVTGQDRAARRLIESMRSHELLVTAAVRGRPRPRVYVEIWGEPLMTAGGGTFVDDLIRLAGGRNIFADLGGWPQVNAEAIILRDPEVILLTYPNRSQVLARRAWRQVAAIRSGRVAEVESVLVSRPGPRIAEGLEQVARILHVEAFP